MKRALVFLACLALGCGAHEPPTPTGSTTGAASDRPQVVPLSAEHHVRANDHNVQEGAVALAGTVLDSSGQVWSRGFEVWLIPSGPRAGAPALSVVFGDETNEFRLWPPPGDYRLEVRTATHVSRPIPVRVVPGSSGQNLQVAVAPRS